MKKPRVIEAKLPESFPQLKPSKALVHRLRAWLSELPEEEKECGLSEERRKELRLGYFLSMAFTASGLPHDSETAKYVNQHFPNNRPRLRREVLRLYQATKHPKLFEKKTLPLCYVPMNDNEDTYWRLIHGPLTREIFRTRALKAEPAAKKRQAQVQRLRKQSPGAAKEHADLYRKHSDADLLKILRQYREKNPHHCLNTAICNLLNPSKGGSLKYANDSTVYKHLGKALKPFKQRPSAWWEAGCPAL